MQTLHRLALLAVAATLLVSAACRDQETPRAQADGAKGLYRVGIFQFTQHPVISEIYQGFRRELDQQARTSSVAISYIERNADGDTAQAASIATYFASSDCDLIFVIGVPAAQALKSSNIKTPVVFGGPPDAVAAGLVPRLSNHGTNFTGTQYLPPVTKILETFRSLFPGASSVAVLHNPAEANSMAVVSRFLAEIPTHGLQALDIGASNATEIDAALRKLSTSNVQGIFIPTDNLIYSNLDRILDHVKGQNIPVFNCTRLATEKGAAFSLATDYSRIGALSARIAGRILISGESPSTIDVLDVQEGHLYVNSKAPNLQPKAVPGYTIVRVP